MIYITTKSVINNCNIYNKIYFPIISICLPDIDLLQCEDILIYMRSDSKNKTTGFCGYFTIKNILFKNDDELLYNNLVTSFCFANINDLFFVECDKLFKLKTPIGIKKYNNTYYENVTVSSSLHMHHISLAKSLNSSNVIANIKNNTTKIISDEDDLKEDNLKEDKKTNYDSDDNNDDNDDDDSNKKSTYNSDDDSDDNSDNDDKTTNDTLTEKINDEGNQYPMSIPILCIPCEEIKKYMESKTIKIKTINNHKQTCNICEFINNNNYDIDFNKKSCCCILKNIDKIIDSYQNIKKYYITDKDIETYNFDITYNNIIYYDNEEHYYNGCIFFIINNNE